MFDVCSQAKRILWYSRAPSDALLDPADARTPESIAADFTIFAGLAPRQLFQNATLVQTDFRTMSPGESILVENAPEYGALWANDLVYTSATQQFVPQNPLFELQPLTPENSARISVALEAGQRVRITALPGFTGIAYFDFESRVEPATRAPGASILWLASAATSSRIGRDGRVDVQKSGP